MPNCLSLRYLTVTRPLTLSKIEIREIGLRLHGIFLSPLLKMGTIAANFSENGI